MNEWTEAERYMMDQVRLGNNKAWAQLVDRYQGRLIAFARSRSPKSVEAEDVVQDTFVLFLRGLHSFRQESSIETFLFTILRRRLAEMHRGKKITVCELPISERSSGLNVELPAPDPTASSYALRDEQRKAAHSALAGALDALIGRMKTQAELQELLILEMIFYAQQSNQWIAATMKVDTNYIAVRKHRWIKQLHEHIEKTNAGLTLPWGSAGSIDSLLTETWEEQRPSCPKRSTIGGYLLGTLDPEWSYFADRHITLLGCSFCKASLQDLREQSAQNSSALRHRILQSTVGFLHQR